MARGCTNEVTCPRNHVVRNLVNMEEDRKLLVLRRNAQFVQKFQSVLCLRITVDHAKITRAGIRHEPSEVFPAGAALARDADRRVEGDGRYRFRSHPGKARGVDPEPLAATPSVFS